MELEGWTFSKHALARAVDMAIGAEELTAVLRRPPRVWSDARAPDCRYLSNRRITLSVDIEAQQVISVLWYREPGLGSGDRRYDRSDFEAEMKRIRDAK